MANSTAVPVRDIASPDPLPNAYASRTHCPAGHPYDEENTYRRADGSRKCRACHRIRARAVAAERGWRPGRTG